MRLDLALFLFFVGLSCFSLGHTVGIKRRSSILSVNTTIQLTDYRLVTEYLAPISIGSPFQNFDVLIDTGSPYLIIPSIDCTLQACYKKKLYNPASSTSSVSSGQDFNPKYGLNVFKGVMYGDKTAFGNLTINLQYFDLFSSMSAPPIYAALPWDGILGLSFDPSKKVPSLFDNMINQHLLSENLFCLFLDSTAADASVMNIGEINDEYFIGDPVYLNVSYIPLNGGYYFWTFQLTQLKVGDEVVAFYPGGIPAIADTGTPTIMLPPSIFDKVKPLIPIDENKNCSSAPFPDLIFTFGSSSLTISPEIYLVPRRPNGCQLAIVPENPRSDFIILGLGFLRQFYTIWDQRIDNNYRIGFGQLKSNLLPQF